MGGRGRNIIGVVERVDDGWGMGEVGVLQRWREGEGRAGRVDGGVL